MNRLASRTFTFPPWAWLASFVLCASCASEPSSPVAGPAGREPTAAELFDDAVPHAFVIAISQAEWEGISQDMLDYAEKFPVQPLYDGDGREYRTDKYRKADFIYRHADGTEVKLAEVGVRTRGNESRRLPYRNGQYYKSHFKVKFDETFDLPAGDPATAERGKRRFAGLKALNFKWSRYNAWDSYANKSKINELFSYALLGKAGVIAPRMSMATLTFRIAGKDVDYGVYGIVEPVDKPFLKSRFGGSEGDLYKCLYLDPHGGAHLTPDSIAGERVGVKDVDTNYRPIYDLQTNETSSDHGALTTFVRQLDALSGDDLAAYLDSNFDVSRFVRYLAMGIYINNLDDYRFLANNYYLYFDPRGKVSFIPYDFDISLGTNWHGELSYDRFIAQDLFATTSLPASWGDHSPRPLVDKVLAIPQYRALYLQYLAEYVAPTSQLFVFSQYQAKFDQLFALYGDQTTNDTVDPDPMGLAGFEKQYFFDKTKNVLGQLGLDLAGYEVE